MKFGIEKEVFLTDAAGALCLVPNGIPMDDCGWLVEYRGDPCNSIEAAVGSLKAVEWAVNRHLAAEGLQPLEVPWAKVPRALKLEARRQHIKGTIQFQNLYNLTPSIADTAGVHISFTKPYVVEQEDGYPRTCNLLWDFPRLFKALDQRYLKQIKDAKRKPGFYEIKCDQRIEYRSLPNTIDLWDVAGFIKDWRF